MSLWQSDHVTISYIDGSARAVVTSLLMMMSASSIPISSCQLHVDQQSAIGRSPLLAREHGTVYLATYNIFKKDLKSHLFGLSFSLWQLCTLTMYSALVVVYTAYCTLQIVWLTLHYITWWWLTASTSRIIDIIVQHW